MVKKLLISIATVIGIVILGFAGLGVKAFANQTWKSSGHQDVQQINNDLTQLDSILAQRSTQIKSQQVQLADQQSQLTQADETKVTLNQQISTLNSEKTVLSNQLATTASQLASQQQTNSNSNNQITDLQNQITNLNQQISNLNNTINGLQQQLNAAQSNQNGVSRADYDALTQKYQQALNNPATSSIRNSSLYQLVYQGYKGENNDMAGWKSLLGDANNALNNGDTAQAKQKIQEAQQRMTNNLNSANQTLTRADQMN